MSNEIELGYLKGEQCNRDGCEGVIEEHDSEGSCSCHTNPPCSYCTTSREYCPVCDWDGREEQIKQDTLRAVNAAFEPYNAPAWDATDKKDQIRWRYEPHTHFTMKKVGMYPEGEATIEQVREQVKGTFGGRFAQFGGGTFTYIAYTD